ncbi:MAG: relaxase/mobilization nuclease domain-containing protein [Atopobiaceae bacterium]|nr:relaxase/mobilization nuclease domain-containing protein [Atopobiaceae bacterium]
MPELKIKDGRSPSVRGCIAYLTRGGRAIASDYINCEEVDPDGRPVWKQMDDLRLDAGNGRPDGVHGNAAPRTFEHIIISPDPRDDVDLATLQKLATTWARKYFGDYQVAIYYHEDNRGNIPHAHLVVNNTNVVSGERVSAKMRSGQLRRMNDDLQKMAAELGLRAFAGTDRNADEKARAKAPKKAGRNARTREELAIIAEGGYSWKEDIRQRMVCAVKLSRTESEFLESCSALGLTVRENKRGDWVFSLDARETRQVSGKKLGSDYSRYGIERWLARERSSGKPKISFEAAERMRAALAPMASAGGTAPSILGVIDGRRYTVGDVAGMLDLCEELDIRSMDDFHAASVGPMPKDERERLRASWRLARSLGHLPEHRQRIDGEFRKRRRSSSGGGAPKAQQQAVQAARMPEKAPTEIEER